MQDSASPEVRQPQAQKLRSRKAPGAALDVLAIGTHPDDLEIACGGTLILLARKGYRVGAADLSRGELGTRGTAETRSRETQAANRVLGLSLRLNLEMPDGNIQYSQESLLAVIRLIREHRPRLLLCPYWEERHYDHVHASRLVAEAAFYSGLTKIDTGQASFRPFRVLFYLSRVEFRPSFIVDISGAFEAKMKALGCYRTQFHQGAGRRSAGPQTLISTAFAWEVFESLSRHYGAMIGARHGEPFLVREVLELPDPVAFFRQFPDSRQAHVFPRE